MTVESVGANTSWYVRAHLPWFEFDRMIIGSIEWDWEPTGHVITRVMRECIDRKMNVSEDEVAGRVLDLGLGSLAMTGDIWRWRTRYSAVGLTVYDE